MHSSQVAALLGQGDKRALTCDIADVDAKAFFTQEKVPQLRHSESVTRVYAQYWFDYEGPTAGSPPRVLEHSSEAVGQVACAVARRPTRA